MYHQSIVDEVVKLMQATYRDCCAQVADWPCQDDQARSSKALKS